MLTYTLLLHGLEHPGQGLPGPLLRDLLDALDRGARGSVRLRLEGRSHSRDGFDPVWVHRAAGFELAGLLTDAPGIELRVPTLDEALAEPGIQRDLLSVADSGDTALTLMARALSDAFQGVEESDAYDDALLDAFAGLGALFQYGVERVEVRNGQRDAGRLTITPAGVEAVGRLLDKTPRPRRVRVAGRVETVREDGGTFTLVLEGREVIRCVRAGAEPEQVATMAGRTAVVEGYAHFRPSGRLLRVDAEVIEAARPADLALWSEVPRPLFGGNDEDYFKSLNRPQGPDSGLNAIVGKWPGDETDEEIWAYIEEIS